MKTPKNDSTLTRVALLEQCIFTINDTLNRFERRFDKIDDKFDKIDKRIESMDKKLDLRLNKINNRLWTLLFWMIAGFASTLAVIAKAVHWL